MSELERRFKGSGQVQDAVCDRGKGRGGGSKRVDRMGVVQCGEKGLGEVPADCR